MQQQQRPERDYLDRHPRLKGKFLAEWFWKQSENSVGISRRVLLSSLIVASGRTVAAEAQPSSSSRPLCRFEISVARDAISSTNAPTQTSLMLPPVETGFWAVASAGTASCRSDRLRTGRLVLAAASSTNPREPGSR